MANRNAPSGARVVGHTAGAEYSGKTRQYVVPASDITALFIGDFVKKVEGGEIDNSGNDLSYVAKADVGDAIMGVLCGVVSDSPDELEKIYRPASTKKTVLVADDPGIIFEIQAVGGTVDRTAYEKNANITLAVPGNTAFGTSGVQLDGTTAGTEAAKQLRIIGLINREDNELGEYAKLLCKINKHQRTWNQDGV